MTNILNIVSLKGSAIQTEKAENNKKKEWLIYMKSRFPSIRNRLIDELIYYRENVYEEQLDPYSLEDLLYHVVDIYQVQYGEIDYLQDELLFLTDFVYSTVDTIDMTVDEVYEAITRVLILMEAIDDRAEELLLWVLNSN